MRSESEIDARLLSLVADQKPPGAARRAQIKAKEQLTFTQSPPAGKAGGASQLNISAADVKHRKRTSSVLDGIAVSEIADADQQNFDSSYSVNQLSSSQDVGSDTKTAIAKIRSFSKRHLSVIAIVIVVAVVFTVSQLHRARTSTIPDATAADPSIQISSASPTPKESVVSVDIKVHVLGAVANPGVVTIAEGSRVIDAIQAAGGLTELANLGVLNLAEPVPDGAQIFIGVADEESQLRILGQAEVNNPLNQNSVSSTTQEQKLNLNTATAPQLEELPGVGPVTAQAIIDWRQANGSFTRIEELQEVDGIGPKTFQKLSSYVSV